MRALTLSGSVKMGGSKHRPLIIIGVRAVDIVLGFLMLTVFQARDVWHSVRDDVSLRLHGRRLHGAFDRPHATPRLMRPTKKSDFGAMICAGAPTALSRVCDTVQVAVPATCRRGWTSRIQHPNDSQQSPGAFILGLGQAIMPIVAVFNGEEDHGTLASVQDSAPKLGS